MQVGSKADVVARLDPVKLILQLPVVLRIQRSGGTAELPEVIRRRTRDAESGSRVVRLDIDSRKLLVSNVLEKVAAEAERGQIVVLAYGEGVELQARIAESELPQKIGGECGSHSDQGRRSRVGVDGALGERRTRNRAEIRVRNVSRPPERALLLAEVVIHANQVVVGVGDGLAGRQIILNLLRRIARAVGKRIQSGDIFRDVIDAGCRNDISRKRIPDVFSRTRVKAGGERIVNHIQFPIAIVRLREVRRSAAQLRLPFRTGLPRTFVVEEEKRLIFAVVELGQHHGSADIAAENIALEQSDGDAIAVILPAIGV